MHKADNSGEKEFAGKLAIATTTFYGPDLESDVYRAELATDMVRKATERNYAVAVVDGGSPDEIIRVLERSGAKIFSQESKGMGPGRRQAIIEAYNTGREVIAWTEPEKNAYIPEIWKTAVPIVGGRADIVVPKRKSLDSYPTAQRYAEPFGNAFWKEVTGVDLDVWIGPRTWGRKLSDYFLRYNGKYGDKWDSIFIPLMDAIFDGKRVIGVEVDYTHPKRQSEIEEHDKVFYLRRLEQLNNLMKAFEEHWNILNSK